MTPRALFILSETFRQSGTVTAAARERDPANRLRHHYATRRLEAEGIRDALLAVSGRLDDSIELYGDTVARNAIWKDNPDLGALAGKPVRLRFVMKDADLYSIKFEETK